MDTDSLYLALSEHDLFDCSRPAVKKELNSLQSGDCTDEFSANSTTKIFPHTCCAEHKNHDRREPDLFHKNFRCTELVCLRSKTYCSSDYQTNKIQFSSNGLNKRTLEDSGDGPMYNYRKILEEFINLTSRYRGSCTIQQAPTIYEQTKKGLSYFSRTGNVQPDTNTLIPLIFNYRKFEIICQSSCLTNINCFCCQL